MDDKPKAKITETERIETPKLGLHDRGQITVGCGDCGVDLMVFQIAKNNEDLAAQGQPTVTTTVQVRCDICGGASYRQAIEGMFYPGAVADHICFEPVDEEVENVDVVFRAWSK